MAKTSLWVVGAAVIAVAAGVYYFGMQPKGSTGGSVALATPAGITLQPLGEAQGYRNEFYLHILYRDKGITLADAKGMTLYTYDKDTEPGKSACAGDCAKAWPPATPITGATAFGDWSIVGRDDGAKQWAFKGKPLYTFSKDEDIGSVGGASPKPMGGKEITVRIFLPPKPQGKGLPPDWHAALIYPATIPVPDGIAVAEVADANGLVLVDANAMTMYAFDGDADHDSPTCANPPCTNDWTPVAAPQLNETVGDFSVVSRHDGIQQWAYKGQPLYTFKGDLTRSDAYGIGADKRHYVAQVLRYFMPPNVTMRQTLGRGTVLATADGMTLYRRDAYAWQAGGGHALRHGVPIRPSVGRDIGVQGCDKECLKIWHPFLAPADATPSGYWDVLTREDGTKQWAYEGFAMYTYAGDKKPGDATGNDIYDIVLTDDPSKIIDTPTPMPGTTTLYWIVASP